MKNKLSGLFALIILAAIIIVGCSEAANVEVYDMVVERISADYELEELTSLILSDQANASAELEKLGFSSDTIEFYDDSFFENNVIIAAVMKTCVSYDYSLEEIYIKDEAVQVVLNEIVPQYIEDLLCLKGIIIEVPRGDVENINCISVEIAK